MLGDAFFMAVAVTAAYSQLRLEKAAAGKEKKFPFTTSSAAAAHYLSRHGALENHRWTLPCVTEVKRSVDPKFVLLYMDLFPTH